MIRSPTLENLSPSCTPRRSVKDSTTVAAKFARSAFLPASGTIGCGQALTRIRRANQIWPRGPQKSCGDYTRTSPRCCPITVVQRCNLEDHLAKLNRVEIFKERSRYRRLMFRGAQRRKYPQVPREYFNLRRAGSIVSSEQQSLHQRRAITFYAPQASEERRIIKSIPQQGTYFQLIEPAAVGLK